MLNWNTTKEDTLAISKIVDRYIEFHYSLNIPKQYQRSKLDIMMDVEATHNNGCPLKLQGLLNAKDCDFTHDLIGIQQNINRKTGKLENCFLPRYAK